MQRHQLREAAPARDQADEPAQVRAEGRIVEAPVLKVVVGAVHVPRARRQVDSDLHPVPLRLKVAVHGWHALARVSVERDARTEEHGGEEDAEGSAAHVDGVEHHAAASRARVHTARKLLTLLYPPARVAPAPSPCAALPGCVPGVDLTRHSLKRLEPSRTRASPNFGSIIYLVTPPG